MSTFRSTSDDNDTNFRPSCRICFASNHELMIPSPCDCSGSVGYVHKGCFRRWTTSVRNFSRCEICRGTYKKVGLLPKRSFTKLFKAFFERPFYALCKFTGRCCLTAAVGFTLSRKIVPIFSYLDGIVGDTNQSIFYPTLIIFPLIIAYGYAIESTAISFRNLLFSLSDWWHFSWITVQMSDESIDNNLSTTHEDDENFIIFPIA